MAGRSAIPVVSQKELRVHFLFPFSEARRRRFFENTVCTRVGLTRECVDGNGQMITSTAGELVRFLHVRRKLTRPAHDDYRPL